MLRGFVYAWAVDLFGREINWNFLRGNALIVNYSEGATWAYDAEAFRALAGSRGQTLPESGVLRLDGGEYEWAFSTLRLSFFASGASEFFGGDRTVLIDKARFPTDIDDIECLLLAGSSRSHPRIFGVASVRYAL